jgi:hypothetical protein
LIALALASCASPTTVPAQPGRAGQIDLGDWRRASQRRVAAHFSEAVTRRYEQGGSIAQISADLRANQFACSAGAPSRRGVSPTQVCRRSLRDRECTHTWQVHLFARQQSVARTRALYDRSCGGDGLLGGPA